MNLKDTGCCGTKEITGLSTHKTVEEAMKAFCTPLFEKGTGNWGYYAKTVYTFYIFTAAVYSKEDRDKYVKQHPGYAHSYNLYGHNFAKFIRAKKLGKVWTSAALVNVAFHPDHKVKVWLWSPDKVALKAWWEQNKPAEVPKPEV